MRKLIIINILIWSLVFAVTGLGGPVSPVELLNIELGRPVDKSLRDVKQDPLIGALKRALIKNKDDAVVLCQAAANGRCGDTGLIQQITEMGLYLYPAQGAAIVQAIYSQCPEAEKGIQRAMNAKMVREPKSVVAPPAPPEEDEPTPDTTPPPTSFSFPSPPPSTLYSPVTPITNR